MHTSTYYIICAVTVNGSLINKCVRSRGNRTNVV